MAAHDKLAVSSLERAKAPRVSIGVPVYNAERYLAGRSTPSSLSPFAISSSSSPIMARPTAQRRSAAIMPLVTHASATAVMR